MTKEPKPHVLGDMRPPFVDQRELAKRGPAPGVKPKAADELIRKKAVTAKSLSEFQEKTNGKTKTNGKKKPRKGRSPRASNTVDTPPSSIAELARALKHDADLCFYHVYNNIEFLPTWGLQKGNRCMLDGIGNSFDQCQLLFDLLTESGYTATFVKGVIDLSLAEVQNWLGTGGADIWPTSFFLNDGGIPNDPQFTDGQWRIDVEHLWLKVEIDSVDYVFDPAFKIYTITSPIDLETVTGYDRGTFLSAASSGATVDMSGNWIEDTNAGNINTELATYAGNLIDWIKTNNPTATLDEIIGGRTINQIFTPVRETENPREKEGDTPDEWGTIPNSYRITVRFQYDGIDETLYGDELHGRRVTFFFNVSSEPELKVDGILIGTGNAQTVGTGSWLQATITHPYPVTWFDQLVWMWILAPFFGGGQAYYLIGSTFGTASESMVSYHRRLYAANAFAGSATDEDVLGERLAIRWSMYAGEGSAVADVLGRISGCATINHHLMGLCYLADFPSKNVAAFDVGGVREAYDSLIGDNAVRLRYATSIGMHGYCLEMLSTQQVTGNIAISATRVLETANANGDKIFKGTDTNWTSDVTPNLTGYSGGYLSDIYNNYLQWDWFVLIPEEAPIPIDGYDCTSFAAISLFGGAQGILNTTFGEQGDDGEWWEELLKELEKLLQDPVGMYTGSYQFSQTDMTLGSSQMEFPYQLSFQSRYDSRSRFVTGPLGLGWSHNWMVSIHEQSAGFKGLGSHSPIEAAASIVEMLVHFDLLEDTDYPILNMVSGSLCNSWWAEQLTMNGAVVSGGDGTAGEFIKLPDGSYHPSFRDVSTLVKNMDGSFTLTDKHQVVREFNTDGNLETWEFPNGVTITLTYSTGKLQTVSNNMGRTLTLSYTGDKLTSVSDGNGRSVSYATDVNDQLETITNLIGEDTTFEYGDPGLLVSYFYPEHPTNPFITNTFDSLDRVESQLDMNGREQFFYFAGWRSEFENTLGYSYVYQYDRFGNTLKEIDELGFETVSEFDGLQRITQKTLPEGNSTSWLYDEKNNILTLTKSAKPDSELDDIVENFTYHSTFNKVETYEDGRGNTTTNTYDASTGDLLKIERPKVDSQTPTVTMSYNNRGQILSRIDETGIQTQCEYDGTTEELTSITINTNWQATIGGTATDSDILTITVHDPGLGGGSKAKTYTVLTDDTLDDIAAGLAAAINGDSEITDLGISAIVSGEVILLSTSSGNSTTFSESTSGGATETISLEQGLELTTTYGYNNWGDINSVTDPRGNETTATFNDSRKVTQTVAALPFSTVMNLTYDDNLNLRTIERQLDAGWQIWEMTYNVANQIATVLDPLDKEASYEYNELRDLWKTTDPLERVKEYQYDPRRKLQKLIVPGSINAQTMAYTDNGLIASVEDGRGNVVLFSYDGFDRPDKTTYPGCEAYFEQNALYDENGNVVTKLTRAGDSIAFQFDALNRMTEKTPDGMPTVSFDYDLAGRLIRTSTPVDVGNPASGEWKFGFDTAGRQVSEEAPDGKTVLLNLDENGNSTKIVYPDSYYVDRVYDELNRLTDIKLNGAGTASVHFDFDDLSRKVKIAFDNTVETNMGYELNNVRSSVEHAFDGSDLDFSYSFSDALEMLTQSVSDAQHMWHPSAGGTMEFGPGNSLNQYPYVSGSCGRLFQGYNSNGCLIDDGVFRFGYDTENHLISAENGIVSASYVYDPMHRQIQKNVDGTKTRFAYFGWRRLADYDGTSDTLQNRYIYGANLDEPLITVSSGGTLTYMHADTLGSIVALTDNTGAVTDRFAYSPFGESASVPGTSFGFTGQRFDPETGLYYYKYRYYSPKLGRFLQPDPIGFTTDDLNLYTYVQNNPLTLIDPLGLQSCIDKLNDWWDNLTFQEKLEALRDIFALALIGAAATLAIAAALGLLAPSAVAAAGGATFSAGAAAAWGATGFAAGGLTGLFTTSGVSPF